MSIPLPREIREKAVSRYEECLNYEQVGRELKISASAVARFVKNGIDLKDKKPRKKGVSTRRNKFDDNYFEVIDSDEKAYWLGMFFADGCLYKDKNCDSYRCRLSLDSNDCSHLEKFLTAINFDRSLGRISYSNRKNFDTRMATVQLLSKKMFNDLERLGCVERKSRILLPPLVKSEFDKSFLRGFFDGDGGSTFHVNEKAFLCGVNFVSTKPVLDYISSIIENDLQIKLNLLKVQDWTYRLNFGGPLQVFIFFNWLYDDFSKTYLDRKFEKAKDMMKVYTLKGKSRVMVRTHSIFSSEKIYEIIERFLGEDVINSIFSQSLIKYSSKEFYNLYIQKVSEGLFYSKN